MRTTFTREKLRKDVARLKRQAEPESRISLAAAIREMWPFIERRKAAGWTDTEIAAAISDLGYPISCTTLRSYRSRIVRDAGSAS